MTLPRPPATAPAHYTDVYIWNLALAIDRNLGSAVKVATVPAGTRYTTEAGGEFTVAFPSLGTVKGALILPDANYYLTGPVTTYPPVPPASIGATLRVGPAWIAISYFAAGAVRCRALQPPSDIGDKNGYHQQQSAQPVNSGQVIGVTGFAWAAP